MMRALALYTRNALSGGIYRDFMHTMCRNIYKQSSNITADYLFAEEQPEASELCI